MRLVAFLGDYGEYVRAHPIKARRAGTGDLLLFMDHRMPAADRLRTVVEVYDANDVDYVERVITDPYPGDCAGGFHHFPDQTPVCTAATCSRCGHVESFPHPIHTSGTVVQCASRARAGSPSSPGLPSATRG